MSNVDEIAAAKKRREREREEHWRRLVAATADGEPVDAESAADVLEQLGRTPQDLAAASRRLLARRELRERIVKASKYREQQSELRSQIAAADVELASARAAAEERHAAEVEPLRRQYATLSYSAEADRGAEEEIRRLADPWIIARIRELEARERPARERLHVLDGLKGRVPVGYTTSNLEREQAQLGRQLEAIGAELSELRARLQED